MTLEITIMSNFFKVNFTFFFLLQNVHVIVMLTKLVEGFGFNSIKCAMYWPNIVGGVRRFSDLEVQVSISSTFYARIFCRYPFVSKSLSRMFQLCNLWHQNIGEKCARKMLTAGQ